MKKEYLNYYLLALCLFLRESRWINSHVNSIVKKLFIENVKRSMCFRAVWNLTNQQVWCSLLALLCLLSSSYSLGFFLLILASTGYPFENETTKENLNTSYMYCQQNRRRYTITPRLIRVERKIFLHFSYKNGKQIFIISLRFRRNSSWRENQMVKHDFYLTCIRITHHTPLYKWVDNKKSLYNRLLQLAHKKSWYCLLDSSYQYEPFNLSSLLYFSDRIFI